MLVPILVSTVFVVAVVVLRLLKSNAALTSRLRPARPV